MNNLITRLREAAEDLRKDMGRKDLRTKDILLLSDIRDIAVECADMIERQAAEIARLNQALKWQQDRADRIGTHGDGCWSWGHKHYECALDAIARLRSALALIAAPARPDGTYNRCREACEIIAREAITKEEPK